MPIIKSKRFKIAAAILIVLTTVLLISPTLAKNYLVKNSKSLFGRQVDIGKLKYNYFTSTAKVFDFKMLESNNEDVFMSFDTLIVDLEPMRFLVGEKKLEQFYVNGLDVRVQMNDSTFNFDDFIAFHTEPIDNVSAEEIEFKYDISNLELKEANFYFDDKNVGKETQIENFSFFIAQIVWDQGNKSKGNIEFSFKNGGYFKSDLSINPVTGDFDANVEINKLNLDTFYEYVTQYAEINDFNGSLNSTIHIIGNTEDATKSILSGQAQLSNLSMIDKNGKEFLKTDLASISLNHIDYSNSSYKFGTIKLDRPYIYFEMDSITNNLFSVFKLNKEQEKASEETTQPETPSSLLYYEIDEIKVNSGLMDYSDNLTGERFDYHLNEISINTDRIVSTSDWVNIYADMLLNDRGTLKSKLGLNPNDYSNLNLDMVIENFLLSDINIYANYYVGHSILLGDFYYYSKSKISNGDIRSENQLLVKNVSVENEKGGIFTLPLKFALFLLKDKNGDVNLNVPVRGDLNDPEINIGKLIWTTIKNKITGAASNPIGALAGLVDVKPEDYKELVFTYTDTIPNEDNYIKLDKLLEMETAKEGLKVKLEHYVDTKLQMEALAIEALGQKYFKDKKKDYRKNEKAFKRYVRQETKNDTISIKSAALMLVPESKLKTLATSYQEALRRNINNYLKKKKSNTSIKAATVAAEEPDNTGSLNRFLINFDMLTVMSDEPVNNLDSPEGKK
jgi:hypothetical protein